MEPLGKKLQQARLAKKISLEEASRVTKIRAARIQEIEAEDFSNFSSLAYAKGFLLIYGKFLDVDVTPYLDAFATSQEVSVDGYAYLQDPPSSPVSPIVRRQPAKRPALLPFIIAVGVLVLGLYLVKLLLDIQRITPSRPSGGRSFLRNPAAFRNAHLRISSRRALSPSKVRRPAKPTSRSPPTPEAAVPSSTEPEVRRAEPVHPEDLVAPNVPTPPTRQSCSNHADAENLSARDSGRPDRTGLQWLDRSFGPAADLSRPARDGKSAGAQRGASHEKWSGPRGGRRRCYL